MALATTTLSSAVTVSDNSIVVASATSVAPGRIVRVDDEFMQVVQTYTTGTTVGVLRGRDGTAALAHPATANVVHGLASDFASPPVQVANAATNPRQPALPTFSYSASGAITPVAGIHIMNGTSTLTMTLADPTKDQDGSIMILVSNGKGAHTVTSASGVGNGGSTMNVGTYNTTESTGCILVAINGFWVLVGNGIGSSGTQVAGVVWA